METLERRLDLLKLEGNGLLPAEIVKELSVKYHVSERTVYYDFQKRDKWQPAVEEVEKALLRIINRHEQLYRKASLGYIKAEDTKSKLFALNLMRTLNKDIFDILQGVGKIQKMPEAIELEIIAPWLNKFSSQETNTNHTKGS